VCTSKYLFIFCVQIYILTLHFFISSQEEVDQKVYNEIKHVYQLIKDNGQQGDYAIQLKFGELVPVSVLI
jgi:putative lipase involved disintegration of autophagic bodies